mgnify:CR=1 FL=1
MLKIFEIQKYEKRAFCLTEKDPNQLGGLNLFLLHIVDYNLSQ